MKQNVCRKNKFGYCIYDDTCRNRHIEEVCSDKKCSVFNCEKRHPKICNYFREFERCKFTTYCRYSHKKPTEVIENNERMKAIEDKLVEIEKNASSEKEETLDKQLNHKIEHLENEIKKIYSLINEKNVKIELFEKKFDKFTKTFEEKVSQIQDLENKVKTIEEVFENKFKTLEKTVKQEQNKNESLRIDLQTLDIESEFIRCEQYDFTTNSSGGLRHT